MTPGIRVWTHMFNQGVIQYPHTTRSYYDTVNFLQNTNCSPHYKKSVYFATLGQHFTIFNNFIKAKYFFSIKFCSIYLLINCSINTCLFVLFCFVLLLFMFLFSYCFVLFLQSPGRLFSSKSNLCFSFVAASDLEMVIPKICIFSSTSNQPGMYIMQKSLFWWFVGMCVCVFLWMEHHEYHDNSRKLWYISRARLCTITVTS